MTTNPLRHAEPPAPHDETPAAETSGTWRMTTAELAALLSAADEPEVERTNRVIDFREGQTLSFEDLAGVGTSVLIARGLASITERGTVEPQGTTARAARILAAPDTWVRCGVFGDEIEHLMFVKSNGGFHLALERGPVDTWDVAVSRAEPPIAAVIANFVHSSLAMPDISAIMLDLFTEADVPRLAIERLTTPLPGVDVGEDTLYRAVAGFADDPIDSPDLDIFERVNQAETRAILADFLADGLGDEDDD